MARKTPSNDSTKRKKAPVKRAKKAAPAKKAATLKPTSESPVAPASSVTAKVREREVRVVMGTEPAPGMPSAKKSPVTYLTGQFLIAMPSMADPRFERTLIYMCHHAPEGAMGLIVNKPMTELKFPDILQQLKIEATAPCDKIMVHRGGPVAKAQGFVLHSTDFVRQGSLIVNDDVALSATTDILRAIAAGFGPKRSLMARGYAGWAKGQLDAEIKQNAWLSVPADDELLFSADVEKKWDRALAKLGVSPHFLSGTAGNA